MISFAGMSVEERPSFVKLAAGIVIMAGPAGVTEGELPGLADSCRKSSPSCPAGVTWPGGKN